MNYCQDGIYIYYETEDGNSDWIEISQLELSIPGGYSEEVEIYFDASDLDAGEYSTDILVSELAARLIKIEDLCVASVMNEIQKK